MQSMHVNGLMIETDKRGITMVGDVIVFGDGSVYNTRTGAFNNAGPGEVTVNGRRLGDGSGDPAASTRTSTITREDSFVARRHLSLNLMSAQVTVVKNDSDMMLVEMAGPEALVNAVKIDPSGDTLSITEKGPGGSSGAIVIGNNTFMTSSFGDISIGGISISGNTVVTGGGSPLSIKVHVPYRTAVSVKTLGGNVKIEGIDGPLSVKITGSSDVNASSASGDVDIRISGSGDVRITDGKIRTLNASISGSGGVRFGGTAEDATLQVSGSGDIRVERVLKTPFKRVTGSGDIRVYNVGPAS